MEVDLPFDLIVTIVNKGHCDKVITASKEAGAEGGTIIQVGDPGGMQCRHATADFSEQAQRLRLASGQILAIPHHPVLERFLAQLLGQRHVGDAIE